MSTMPYRSDDIRRNGRFVARFAHQLTVASGVLVGSRWIPVHGDPARSWQIAWWDGPSVALMRYLAADLGGSVAGVAVESLQWSRTITPQTFALALIKNLRAGHATLGDYSSCGDLMAALEEIDHPERGIPRDVALARRLARLGDHLEHGMVHYLEQHGLAALDGTDLADAGQVVMLPDLKNDCRLHTHRHSMQ